LATGIGFLNFVFALCPLHFVLQCNRLTCSQGARFFRSADGPRPQQPESRRSAKVPRPSSLRTCCGRGPSALRFCGLPRYALCLSPLCRFLCRKRMLLCRRPAAIESKATGGSLDQVCSLPTRVDKGFDKVRRTMWGQSGEDKVRRTKPQDRSGVTQKNSRFVVDRKR